MAFVTIGPRSTEDYLVLPSLTRLDLVLSQDLPSFRSIYFSLISLNRVTPGFIGFYWVLLGFSLVSPSFH